MKRGSKVSKATREKMSRAQRRRHRANGKSPYVPGSAPQAGVLSMLQDMVTRGQRAQRAIDELTGVRK